MSSQTLTDIVAWVSNSNPPWLSYPISHLRLMLCPWPVLKTFCVPYDFTVDDMPWLTGELMPWMNRLPRKLLIGRLKMCLQSIHPSMRPLYKAVLKLSYWNAILQHLKQRGCFLLCHDYAYLIEQLLCFHPSHFLTEISRTSIIYKILIAEYGKDILDEFSRPFLTWKETIRTCVKSGRLEKRIQDRMTMFKLISKIGTSWPHIISHEIVFEHLNEYLEGTL
jgi:hypothetical protein